LTLPTGGREAVASESVSNQTSLAALHSKANAHGYSIESFRLEGVVCAVLPKRNQVVLQDGSGTMLLETPALPGTMTEGRWIAIEGRNCAVARQDGGLQLGTAPVVNNDGRHSSVLRSGEVYLKAGMQPIRVAWFNWIEGASLRIEYQGPGLPRQKIPSTVLWRSARRGSEQTAEFERGLDFAAFEGSDWVSLPDFKQLTPVRTGKAKNLDIGLRSRPEQSGLVFTGWISIPSDGAYTFFVQSDDGAQLYVGDPKAVCQVTPLERITTPVTKSLNAAHAGATASDWVEFSGEVSFAGQTAFGAQLEIESRHGRMPVSVLESDPASTAGFLHEEIRSKGVCEFSNNEERKIIRIIVPGAEHVEKAGSSDGGKNNILLTAERVRRLKPEESRKHLRARLTGVVIWSGMAAFVLHDGTGGVYTHMAPYAWPEQPRVGQCWEVEGTTDPGDFSPVLRTAKARFLGNAPMPDPIRPGWDQLMNGSLDAEYVEIRGVVTSANDKEIGLLTPDGRVRIKAHWAYPLPILPGIETQMEAGKDMRSACNSTIGSVVRMRGCLTAEWDSKSGQVKGGDIHLSPSIVSVDEPAPANVFDTPLRKAADLLRFDALGGALQRVKVAGQIIYDGPRDCCLWDGQMGIRLLPHPGARLRAGDLVEAVGFPHLGEGSPMLQEAAIRTVGRASLPEPVVISGDDLANGKHDATMVRIEGELVNDALHHGERVLEVHAGSRHFLARVKTQPTMAHVLLPGSRVQLTGVYSSFDAEPADPELDAFQLLLNNAADIRVLRQPPWWTVRRAIAVASALAGGLAVALVWITVLRRKVEQRTAELRKQIEQRKLLEQRRAMEQERTRVAQDLHDELGAGLTEVSILGSLARNPAISSEKRDTYLNQLTDAARSLITGLDEIVWAINPHYDSVNSLASYYSLFAQGFLNLAHIACRLEISDSLPEHPLDARARHGIFLAFKEALNNIVRHSGATEVRLKIEVAEKCLSISIADNGRGFRPGGHSVGRDGIAGMRRRMDRLGGECHIYSGSGRGSLVRFRLPLQGFPRIHANGERQENGLRLIPGAARIGASELPSVSSETRVSDSVRASHSDFVVSDS
jgi:signal transduction histidine kinase